MTTETPNNFARLRIHALVMVTGMASLSWEIFWQIKSALALGVSAWGAALTLAVTMAGLSLGSLLMGIVLDKKTLTRPVRLYGVLEIVIGIAGLLLAPAFSAVERFDTLAYAAAPGSGSLVHILGITVVLGVPALCMGATLPVFGLMARQFDTSIAKLYGLNTLGAACGALLAALFLIPLFGVTHASWVIAGVNIAVGIATWLLGPGAAVTFMRNHATHHAAATLDPKLAQLVVIVTGFATFALEVAWFRSLTAALHSTTVAFAIMLATVLCALGAAARLTPLLKRMNASFGALIATAGILILFATPLVERADYLISGKAPADFDPSAYMPLLQTTVRWFLQVCTIIGIPMIFLGMAFPWILDDQHTPKRLGKIYALNTVFAVGGAVGAAWILLPTIGFARTSWLAGALVAAVGLLLVQRRRRILWGALTVVALLVAVIFESGVGRTRIQGAIFILKPAKVLEFYEGPAVTTSVAEYVGGERRLIIDGSSASGQTAADDAEPMDFYLAWMGRLPMLLHPDPKTALVICFGTGQTAHALRTENPTALDIVDINPSVYKLAHNFVRNENVLDDPRVTKIVMDGRAFMRRAQKTYDVITLEPMPPVFAGVNALYSREFYELARAHLNAGGTIAQWLPFTGLMPHTSTAIAKSFMEVFPNAILWIDGPSKTGILLASKDDRPDLGAAWPGFARTKTPRTMTEAEVRAAVKLDQPALARYVAESATITDDNQLLAYGNAVYTALIPSDHRLETANFDAINAAAAAK